MALEALIQGARRRRFPLLALGAVIILMVVGLIIGALSEQAYRNQSAREAGAQARLLASSVTAALAFDDQAEVQAMVNAVQVNPRVLAAAVFDENGRLVASYLREGEPVPTHTARREEFTEFADGRLRVFREVREAGQLLGFAALRLQAEPLESRMARYSGLAMLLLMALVAVGVLGVAQSALGRANAQLRARAVELSEANERLQAEMEERARAEAALRQSQKMEAIGRLTGGVAHDFNNLLMVASSGIDLMDRTEDPKKREALKAGVKQAVERGAALTKQLLAFSRSSALKPEVVDLHVLIESMRVLLERSLREDIQVVIDVPTGLWPVEIDVNELELALLNVAVNARDAMPEGGVLTVSARNVAGRGDGLGEHGHGHVPGDAEPRLRALLHHQGSRQGHGPGPEPGVRLRALFGRGDPHRERGGRGDHHIPVPATLAQAVDLRGPTGGEGAVAQVGRPDSPGRGRRQRGRHGRRDAAGTRLPLRAVRQCGRGPEAA